MKLMQWYSRQKKAIKEVGDKLDANDKAAVEADMQALKDVLAKSTRKIHLKPMWLRSKLRRKN